MRALISRPVADCPFKVKFELLDFALRVRLMTKLGFPFGLFSSISI